MNAGKPQILQSYRKESAWWSSPPVPSSSPPAERCKSWSESGRREKVFQRKAQQNLWGVGKWSARSSRPILRIPRARWFWIAQGCSQCKSRSKSGRSCASGSCLECPVDQSEKRLILKILKINTLKFVFKSNRMRCAIRRPSFGSFKKFPTFSGAF